MTEIARALQDDFWARLKAFSLFVRARVKGQDGPRRTFIIYVTQRVCEIDGGGGGL